MKVAIVFEDVDVGVRFSIEGVPPQEEMPEDMPMSLLLASIWYKKIHESLESSETTVH